MAGWLTNQVPQLTQSTGLEQASFDTENASGQNPQTAAISVAQLAVLGLYYGTFLAAGKTLVAGSRYFIQQNIGAPGVLTGINVLVGGTGGTDKWLVELHSPTGVLLATSALAGVTAGTAATWQQIAFTATYNLQVPGLYWVTVQTNGTTATLACINSPTYPLFTGSSAGTLGTSASITPATTYTANLGPIAFVY